jgi:ketosteroid isomerase-like protein
VLAEAQTIEGSSMNAHEPGEASTLFERYFAEGDLDSLMSLYEKEAVFPTANATSTGWDEIRQTLKAYLDSGAKLVFGESLVFPAGELALVHTPWTMHMPNGSSSEGATAEVLRRQADGKWKFVIDNPDGTALLKHA